MTQTRQTLLNELNQHVCALDNAALAELNAILASRQRVEPDGTGGAPSHTPTSVSTEPIASGPSNPNADRPSTPRRHNRRDILIAAALLGGGGAATATAGGLTLWDATQSNALNGQQENAHLRNLLELYKALDQVGVDEVAGMGILRVAQLLQRIVQGAQLLKTGLERVEEALARFDRFVARIRSGLDWVEDVIVAADRQLQQMTEDVALLGRLLNPLLTLVADFTDQSLGLLPEPVETPVRDALVRLRAVAVAIPETVAGIHEKLVIPLRENGFGREEHQRVEKSLVEPLMVNLLDPLKTHLDELAALADEWEEGLVQPLETAVADRQLIRAQIAQYRTKNDLV